MNYGLPYKGSKNLLAEKIVDLFPSATNFYDLFCGGSAISHRALIVDRWENYFINDLDKQLPELFLEAIQGKYKNENRWISREDFTKQKDSNAFIRYCWSFGNNGHSYIYGREIEPFKKALHYAVFNKDLSFFKALKINVPDCPLEDIKERRLFYQKYFKKLVKRETIPRLQHLEALERLNCLESLSRLERVQSLSGLETNKTIKTTGLSYDEIEIKPDSIIYCDIPYKNTDKYQFKFDYEKFYKWCSEQKELVFISSYELPAEQFVEVASFNHRSILCSDKNIPVIEKVFIPKHQVKLYEGKTQRLLQ